jgi:predicted Zn-dependent protease
MHGETDLSRKKAANRRKNLFIGLIFAGILAGLLTSFAYVRLNYKERKEDLILKLNYVSTLDEVHRRLYLNHYFELARLLTREKDYDSAIDVYERALEINSRNKQALFELALAFKENGMKQEAWERFSQLLESGPGVFLFLWAKLEMQDLRPGIDFVLEKKPGLEGVLKETTIYILPLVPQEKEGVLSKPRLSVIKENSDFFDDIRVLLQDSYHIQFKLLPDWKGPIPGYDKKRKQYYAGQILSRVYAQYQELLQKKNHLAILVITSYDITEPWIDFLFGTSDGAKHLGIISDARLKLDKPDEVTFFRRVFTQSLSTGGFLLGIEMCSSPGCARSYPHSFLEFRKKKFTLCAQCLQKLLSQIQLLQDVPNVEWKKEDMERLKQAKDKYGLAL